MTQVAERGNGAVAQDVMERVLIGGDLSKLNPGERLNYYKAVCDSLGLNSLTKPLEYIQLNGKLRLYALKDCTEQLRKIHGVSVERLEKQNVEGVYVVTAYAKDKSGRTDGSTGAVTITGLKGEALANALMKAETKAKRRVTLSICGLGMLDETEADAIPNARVIPHEAIPEQAITPHDEDFTNEERVAAVERHQDAITTIKAAIKTCDYDVAAPVWFNLPEREQLLLWFPERRGGPFTNDERKQIKSAEFRQAFYRPE